VPDLKTDPLSTALKEIIATRDILETLITGSESFDYFQAKAALKELNRKARNLARLRSKFEALQSSRQPNICVVDFKPALHAPDATPQPNG